MQEQFSSRWVWFLFLLSGLLLFSSLGKMPLWIYDEVRNAECAREMWERGDWIVPTFNGELRTLKPPLHYYFMFGGFDLFGVTEWGARFFSAVFGMLTLGITYFFVCKNLSRLHALITTCILLASTHFLFQFRMSVPDPYLIFFNALALYSAFEYFKLKKVRWILLCAISLGLGALAKGPVAIVLPAVSILIWLIWQKNWKAIFHWHILLAVAVTLIIAVPWYVAVHLATDGEWSRGFFLEHNLGRFSEPMEGHGGFFILVPLFILAGLLPASVFIGESLRNFKEKFKSSFIRLAFSVLMVFVIFYSLSGTKLPNYPMPCYPFGAMVLAHFITVILEGKTKARIYPFLILLVICLALPFGLYIGIKNEEELTGLQNLAFIAGILSVGSIASLYLFYKNGFKPAIICLMIFYTLFNLVFFNYLYPAIYLNNPLSKTIAEVKKYDNIVSYKIFHPSYTFYLPNRITVFEQADALKNYLEKHNALVITRESLLGEIDSIGLHEVATHHDLFESATTAIYTNEKK